MPGRKARGVESDIPTKLTGLHSIAVLHIVVIIVIPFYTQGKFDPLARKLFLYFVEGHEFPEVVSRLKLQLLSVSGRLVLVRGTRLSARA